jgi:hypothetical protein
MHGAAHCDVEMTKPKKMMPRSMMPHATSCSTAVVAVTSP